MTRHRRAACHAQPGSTSLRPAQQHAPRMLAVHCGEHALAVAAGSRVVLFCPVFDVLMCSRVWVVLSCSCASGSVPNTGTATGATGCVSCAAGSYSVSGDTACTTCSAGQYSPGSTSACSSCPAGVYGSTTGLTTSACTGPCSPSAGYGCYAGSTSSSGTACNTGQYNPGGSATCLLCPAGQHTSSTGSTSCVACLAGTYAGTGSANCAVCSTPGTYSPPSSGSCPACPTGQFSAYPASSGCAPCPVGTYAAGTGTAGCPPCSGGYYGVSTGLTSSTCSGTVRKRSSAALHPGTRVHFPHCPSIVVAIGVTPSPLKPCSHVLGSATVWCVYFLFFSHGDRFVLILGSHIQDYVYGACACVWLAG